jgi:cobalt/nickel transport system permease protein
LVSLLPLFVGVAILRGLGTSLLAAMLAVVVVLLARVPWPWLGTRLLGLGLFLALFAGPLALLGRPTEALVIVLKGVSLGMLTAVLLVSAPIEHSAQAARSLGMPALLVHLFTLTYRYTFLLSDELQRLRLALRLRGFRNRADVRSYEVVAAATGTLLVRGADRAERVAAAMRCRGFDGQFVTLRDGRTGLAEVLTFTASVVSMVCLIWWEWC